MNRALRVLETQERLQWGDRSEGPGWCPAEAMALSKGTEESMALACVGKGGTAYCV